MGERLQAFRGEQLLVGSASACRSEQLGARGDRPFEVEAEGFSRVRQCSFDPLQSVDQTGSPRHASCTPARLRSFASARTFPRGRTIRRRVRSEPSRSSVCSVGHRAGRPTRSRFPKSRMSQGWKEAEVRAAFADVDGVSVCADDRPRREPSRERVPIPRGIVPRSARTQTQRQRARVRAQPVPAGPDHQRRGTR